MKLATLRDGSRDGQLAVVARDLKTAHLADGIAPTLQRALDDWAFIAPQLEELSRELNNGRGRYSFDFDPKNCMAPLPRAFQRAAAAAYLHHLELSYRSRGAALPDCMREQPLLYQAGGDALAGPCDDIELLHEEWGLDFEGEVAAIADDIDMGATPDQAFRHIRLLMLGNNVTLRNLVPDELDRRFGLLHSKPVAAFSAVAVTPDELGEAWRDGRIHLPLRATWNDKLVGQPQAGVDMAFHFGQLLSHLARSRPLRAGTIVGSGAVSNQDGKRGYASIAEQRNREIIAGGAPVTPWMAFGDTIRLDMPGSDGKSVFGAIEQAVRRADTPVISVRNQRAVP